MAVSVKNGDMAGVFETICSIAMKPCVHSLPSLIPRALTDVACLLLLRDPRSLLHHCAMRDRATRPGTETRRYLVVLIGHCLRLRG